MKRSIFILTAVLLVFVQATIAQTKECKETAEHFFTKCEWREGLKFTPHASINKEEFMAQYHKNKAIWDKAFAFLRENNLDSIKPGKYPIAGDSLYASVTESVTKEMANSKWEFHKKYIDLQMVIKGSEKMGIAPVLKTTMLDAYNETKDVGFAAYPEGDYYVAEAGTFFLFFPSDAHRPSLKVDGCDKDKKIVLKIMVN